MSITHDSLAAHCKERVKKWVKSQRQSTAAQLDGLPASGSGSVSSAMAALRFRFAPPPASHGAGDNLELTINMGRSVGAGKEDVLDDVECVYNPTRRHSTLATLGSVDLERAAE